jgi:hypothetical protein
MVREKQERGEDVSPEQVEQQDIDELMKDVKPEHWEEKTEEQPVPEPLLEQSVASAPELVEGAVSVADPTPAAAVQSTEGDELDQMLSDLK